MVMADIEREAVHASASMAGIRMEKANYAVYRQDISAVHLLKTPKTKLVSYMSIPVIAAHAVI
jgi:hypothetical protein